MMFALNDGCRKFIVLIWILQHVWFMLEFLFDISIWFSSVVVILQTVKNKAHCLACGPQQGIRVGGTLGSVTAILRMLVAS